MHDIDRTLMEYENEADVNYDGEWEYGPEPEFEDERGYDPEYEFENEAEYDPAYAAEFEYDEFEFESVFDEAEEMELAAELLAVSNEAELDQFLGKVFRKVTRAVKKVPFKHVGRTLFKRFRPILRRTVPLLGRAAGTYFGGPMGGQIGSMAASRLGRRFGLELEGLSPEDQEFEVSRRVVRLMGSAVANAAKAPPTAHPDTVAKNAIKKAIQTTAPNMPAHRPSRVTPTPCGSIPRQTGRWYRSKSGKIVLVGL